MFVQVATPRWVASLLENAMLLIGHLCMRLGESEIPSCPDHGQAGLRPESCWNDCLARRKSIRLCVPSHVAYEVGAARQQTVRSPRTMDPHSQEWHRNREATVYLPA